jgi:hypothetical protein
LQFYRKRDDRIFLVVLLLGIIHAILNLVPEIKTQYAAIAFFSILRSLKWIVYGEFFVKHWKLEEFGTVFGISNLFVGIFNLLTYCATWLSNVYLDSNYFPVNLTLTILEVFAIGTPMYLYYVFVRRPITVPRKTIAVLYDQPDDE